MWELSVPAWELVARSVLVYALFLVFLRIAGKRELGQFTIFDLALVLLAANAMQPAITGPDASLPGAFVIVLPSPQPETQVSIEISTDDTSVKSGVTYSSPVIASSDIAPVRPNTCMPL